MPSVHFFKMITLFCRQWWHLITVLGNTGVESSPLITCEILNDLLQFLQYKSIICILTPPKNEFYLFSRKMEIFLSPLAITIVVDLSTNAATFPLSAKYTPLPHNFFSWSHMSLQSKYMFCAYYTIYLALLQEDFQIYFIILDYNNLCSYIYRMK